MIDGAGPFRILRSVIVPQAIPAIVAVTLFHFFFAWNEFLLSLVYVGGNPDLWPLSLGMQKFALAVRHAAAARPGQRDPGHRRAGRRLLPRPARVHARGRRDRRRQVTRPTIRPADDAPSGLDWPAIPRQAWRRGIGVPCPDVGHPRVERADGRRRRVGRRADRRAGHGEHRAHVPRRCRALASRGRPASVRAGRGRRVLAVRRDGPGDEGRLAADGAGRAVVLSALRPPSLPAWGWDLPVGGGTYHALFPRAWQTFEPEVLGVRA